MALTTPSEKEEFYREAATYASWSLIKATFLALGYCHQELPKEYHRWIEHMDEIVPVFQGTTRDDVEWLRTFSPFMKRGEYEEICDYDSVGTVKDAFINIETEACYPDADKLIKLAKNYVESGELEVVKRDEEHTVYSLVKPQVFIAWCRKKPIGVIPPPELINALATVKGIKTSSTTGKRTSTIHAGIVQEEAAKIWKEKPTEHNQQVAQEVIKKVKDAKDGDALFSVQQAKGGLGYKPEWVEEKIAPASPKRDENLKKGKRYQK